MKAILLTLLLALALCDEMHYLHYKGGNLVVNTEPAVKVEGPIFIEFLKTMNITAIAGMHLKGSVKTPFGFSARIVSFNKSGDKIDIRANCTEASWGVKPLHGMKGEVRITGTFQKAEYYGWCYHEATKQNFSITATGNYVKCPIYLPPEAAVRARILVGEKAEGYQPIHVLNFAVMGYPYINSIANCSWWLDKFTNQTAPKPGYVIVGKDGAHCGILDKEGDKVIHSNPAKKLVTETPLSLINEFFKNGYVLKEYHC
jgi:hypothetical protein